MTAAPLVLVIEDQKSVRETICGYLEGLGLQVQAVADGLEAVKFFGGAVPDVVIVDINIPGLDGLKVTQVLRGKPGGKNTEVVFLTATQDVKHVAAGVNLGARLFLTKPISKSDFLKKLEPVFKRKKEIRAG